MTVTFSGLIRAHGEGTGATISTNSGETTFATTESGDTTTWNPDETTVSTEITTASAAVLGTSLGDGNHLFSTYWWFKAKIYSSNPNPSGSVTMTIQAAGAEIGSGGTVPPEQVGPAVTITGSVDSTGSFSSSHTGSVGTVYSCAIAYLPGLPPTTPVDVCLRVDSVTSGSDHITMKGKVWAETLSIAGSLLKSTEYDWESKVTKI